MKICRFFLMGLLCILSVGMASGQSSRGGMGSVPYADANGTGVTFRTWAPNATTVQVKGSFSGWGSIDLAADASGGTWSVDVDRASAGDEYKFVLNGTDKKDPRSKRMVNSAGNSIVYDPNAFDWGGAGAYVPYHNDLVIYELHVGSYNAEDWLPSTFDECGEKIAYLKALGISAVELMPVNEFPGDRSWGYNPSDPYAIESSFGGPDGLKRFVKTCHENGIAVILDVVHNHYGPSDLGDGLWQYDGWSQDGYGGIYFYNDWKANTDWGSTRPDYGRDEVRTYIKDQIRMFLEEYRVDGFRWDSVYNILNTSGTWNDSGQQLLEEVNNMMASEFPNAIRIAEDNAFDAAVNFQAQWDHGYLSDIRWLATAASDSDRDMDTLAYHLGNGSFSDIVYVESHDTCGDLNDKHRLPYDIDSANPWSYYAKKRALLANTIVLVSPGIPMIFEGSEMNEDYTFSNNTALRWSLTETFAGIVQAYSDLIHLRRNTEGVSGGLKQPGNVDVHHVNNTAKVVGLIRWDQGGGVDDLVIAINCSATAYTGYVLDFPSSGTWYCLYNSDSQAYDSSFGGVGPAVGGTVTAASSASLDLGAYSMQIYSKSSIPIASSASFNPEAPDGCGSTVTITYTPADGPLKDAAAVYAFVGRNDWQYPSNLLMTASGEDWTLAYLIPDDTYEVNVSFTDGDTLWDNHNGNNWSVEVSNCGDLPAEVTISPSSPQGCVPVTITYEANGGVLMNSTQVYLYIGRNDWQTPVDVPLTLEGNDSWSTSYSIPDDTWQLDFAFKNSSNQWDNNSGQNWSVVVRDCLNPEEPLLLITSPDPNTTVPNTISSHSVQGTASLLEGDLIWTNTLNGLSGTTPYSTNWNLAPIPLAVGVNLIRVSGTNSSVNPNNGAWDSPTNDTYVSGMTWTDGSNGGNGLQPWEINGSGATLASTNTDTNSLSLGPYAWALQADGGYVEALRPFSSPLQQGDQISFIFENGGVDGTPEASVGFALENRFDQELLRFYFYKGDTNWTLYDSTKQDSGIPWSNTPKTCTLEIPSPLTYRLTVNGQAFEGELAAASELLISHIRFWNYNAGGEEQRKFYIGNFSLTGDLLPVTTYASEVAVTRSTPPPEVVAFVSDGDYLIATLNNASGIQGNIWSANDVDGEGWNWSPLSPDDYVISSNTVTITPAVSDALQVISMGTPGG